MRQTLNRERGPTPEEIAAAARLIRETRRPAEPRPRRDTRNRKAPDRYMPRRCRVHLEGGD